MNKNTVGRRLTNKPKFKEWLLDIINKYYEELALCETEDDRQSLLHDLAIYKEVQNKLEERGRY